MPAATSRPASPRNWSKSVRPSRPSCWKKSPIVRSVGLPPEIADDMETSQVSIFAVNVQRNELKSRMEMTDIVNRRRMRHAHMVNINHEIMLEGMRADFNRVDALSKKVMEMVTKAKQVTRQEPRGQRPRRRSQSQLQVDQDQRHHQPGQVGQPSRRRDLHYARRSQRDLRGRWRGRRLSVREVS